MPWGANFCSYNKLRMNLPVISTASSLTYLYQALVSLRLRGWGESEAADLLIVILVASLQQSYPGFVNIVLRSSGVKHRAFKADIALIILIKTRTRCVWTTEKNRFSCKSRRDVTDNGKPRMDDFQWHTFNFKFLSHHCHVRSDYSAAPCASWSFLRTKGCGKTRTWTARLS